MLSIFLLTAVIIAIINQKYFRMQTTIAVMVAAILLSLCLILLEHSPWPLIAKNIHLIIKDMDFSKILIDYMLGFLLFAGAMTIDQNIFKKYITEILTLATLSTIISTAIIFILFIFIKSLFSLSISTSGILLFAALISPTDPIAVLNTLKSMQAPKSIGIKIAGESLFNDGVGIVVFITILESINQSNVGFDMYKTFMLFVQQALGGITYGAVLGYIIRFLIKNSHGAKLHILISIALVTTGYSLAQSLNISGPLAIVVSGMLTTWENKNYKLNNATKNALHDFWEIIDELLNIVLFFFIGVEIIIINNISSHIISALSAIPLVLLARFISISLPYYCKILPKQKKNMLQLLTWGGLRGGLAIALALSLPQSADRPVILIMTYAVVLFSIIIQGSTVKSFVSKIDCKKSR